MNPTYPLSRALSFGLSSGVATPDAGVGVLAGYGALGTQSGSLLRISGARIAIPTVKAA